MSVPSVTDSTRSLPQSVYARCDQSLRDLNAEMYARSSKRRNVRRSLRFFEIAAHLGVIRPHHSARFTSIHMRRTRVQLHTYVTVKDCAKRFCAIETSPIHASHKKTNKKQTKQNKKTPTLLRFRIKSL